MVANWTRFNPWSCSDRLDSVVVFEVNHLIGPNIDNYMNQTGPLFRQQTKWIQTPHNKQKTLRLLLLFFLYLHSFLRNLHLWMTHFAVTNYRKLFAVFVAQNRNSWFGKISAKKEGRGRGSTFDITAWQLVAHIECAQDFDGRGKKNKME